MKIKGITMQDLLNAYEAGKRRDEYVKEALARGGRTLVVDENVEAVVPYLKQKNYFVDTAYGTDEQIKQHLLDGKILITNNEKDFIDREDRVYYHYGLLSVPNIDSELLSDYVEKCLMKAGFKSNLLQVWKIYKDGKFEKVD